MKNNELFKSIINDKNLFSFINDNMLPNPDRVLSLTGRTYEAYRELKYDAHVWSCLQSRKSGLLNLDYSISGSSEKINNDVSKMLAKLDLKSVFRSVLESLFFGFQPIEIIWNRSGGKNKYIYPEQLVPKPQEWFTFDQEGKLMLKNKEHIPNYKVLCPVYEGSGMNPYGEALLGRCYWYVKFKKGGLKMWINFIEKFGMPVLIGKFQRGSNEEESRELLDKLSDMAEDSVLVAPADIDIEIKDNQKQISSDIYLQLIKHCNSEISKALLSQTLTTELDMGSYAAAQTHYRIRREVINSDAGIVEKTMNELIEYMVKLNFGQNIPPKFNFLITDSENTGKFERDLKLHSSNAVKFTQKYWKKTYGFKNEDIKNTDC